MRPWSRRGGVAAAAFTLGLASVGAMAQECSLRLSNFEATTQAYTADVAAASRRLERAYSDFVTIEAEAVAVIEACPAGLDESRTLAEALVADAGALYARSDLVLDCGRFFNQRILDDTERAMTANDSQMVLRLGDLQERIFAIDREVTDTVRQATFIALRSRALLAEHDALGSRCSLLSTIYD